MKFGIRHHLLLITIIPSLLLVGLFLSMLYREAGHIEHNFNQYGTLLAQQLALTARYAVITGNYNADSATINSIFDRPEVRGLTVQDHIGNTLIKGGLMAPPPLMIQPGTDSTPCRSTAAQSAFCVPIEQEFLPIDDFLEGNPQQTEREIIGWVWLELSHEQMDKQWQLLLWDSLLITLLMAAALLGLWLVTIQVD